METYLTRVEHWECDFNGHWNTRYFGFAFDQAAKVVAANADARSHGSSDLTWHVRFHRELVSADLVQVLSSKVYNEGGDGAVLHLLTNGTQISATALQMDGPDVLNLPRADPLHLQQAKPRGLAPGTVNWDDVAARPQHVAMLGLFCASSLDAFGRLSLSEALTYCGRGSHAHRELIGIGPSFTRQSGISPMLVEMRICLNPGNPLNIPVTMASSLLRVNGKSFVSAHMLRTIAGDIVARIELCLLAVDTVSRKAVQLPAFLSHYVD